MNHCVHLQVPGGHCVCAGDGGSLCSTGGGRIAGESGRCCLEGLGTFLDISNLIFLIAVMNFLYLKMHFLRVSSIFVLIYFILLYL